MDLNRIFSLGKRKPSTDANLVALKGAVMIYTSEGNVVLTPELAVKISKNLPDVAEKAELVFENPSKNAIPL